MRAAAVTAIIAAVIAWITVRRTAPTLEQPTTWHCAAGGPPPAAAERVSVGD